jgi:hypothetical protein
MKKNEIIDLVEAARDQASQSMVCFGKSSNPQELALFHISQGRFDAYTTILDALRGNAVCLKIEAGVL